MAICCKHWWKFTKIITKFSCLLSQTGKKSNFSVRYTLCFQYTYWSQIEGGPCEYLLLFNKYHRENSNCTCYITHPDFNGNLHKYNNEPGILDVEFHFLSSQQIYFITIFGLLQKHSSARDRVLLNAYINVNKGKSKTLGRRLDHRHMTNSGWKEVNKNDMIKIDLSRRLMLQIYEDVRRSTHGSQLQVDNHWLHLLEHDRVKNKNWY